MAFPLTHLLVANELLRRTPLSSADAAQFLLGSLAPDAVHYRKDIPADMGGIGPMKKVSHLCPVSEEPWGKVTANDEWIASIKEYSKNNKTPIGEGYAVHCLTDLCNNITLWSDFRKRYPLECAKGYNSGYYQDLNNIDVRLFLDLGQQFVEIFGLLEKAKACDMPGLVSAEEMDAIRKNILYVQYKAPLATPSHEYAYVTYDQTLDFIQDAANLVQEVLK